MPKFIEGRLRAAAARKGKKGREADRYVFGAMNNQGLMHGNKITEKGEQAQREHEAQKRALRSMGKE